MLSMETRFRQQNGKTEESGKRVVFERFEHSITRRTSC
jgi:hypothetical protein